MSGAHDHPRKDDGEMAEEEIDTTHKALIALLRENNVEFTQKHHPPTKTSEESALVRGSRLEEGAKAMILRSKGCFYLVVFSASEKLDLKLVKKALGTKSLSFASEEEARSCTKGVRRGGIPPFGSLWNIPTFMDVSLRNVREIEFNAGLRTDSVRMCQNDYERIEQPSVVDVCLKPYKGTPDAQL